MSSKQTQQDKEARRAAALRANLKKRKAVKKDNKQADDKDKAQ